MFSKPEKIWKIFFSATGTTKKIVESIADGLSSILDIEEVQHNFTLPSGRQSFPQIGSNDLVIFGVPTYAGRIPNLLLKYLDTIAGNNAWAVPIVTFGNRAFDNSLVELRNILENHGFKTIAGAAFACEHSFSHSLAAGRPDDDDIAFAKVFANRIHEKITEPGFEISQHCPIQVDGDETGAYYQPQTDEGVKIDIRKVKPKTNANCTKCGTCAKICPMGAISFEDFSRVEGICIKCCACVKKCPIQAKYFDDEGYLYHKNQLERNYSRYAENKMFI